MSGARDMLGQNWCNGVEPQTPSSNIKPNMVCGLRYIYKLKHDKFLTLLSFVFAATYVARHYDF